MGAFGFARAETSPAAVGVVPTVPISGPAAAGSERLPAGSERLPSGSERLSGAGWRTPSSFLPQRLAVPKLGVSAPVVPVAVDAAGDLGVPDDAQTLGWWRAGARPGTGRGSVVVVGHVDTADGRRGVLFRAAGLRPGDTAAISDGDKRRDYRVVGLRRYPRAALPAEQVFGQSGSERLVLITCTGQFDRKARSYRENLVVYLVPVADRVAPAG